MVVDGPELSPSMRRSYPRVCRGAYQNAVVFVGIVRVVSASLPAEIEAVQNTSDNRRLERSHGPE